MGKGTKFHCKNTSVDIGIGYIQVIERWLSKIWWRIGQTSFNSSFKRISQILLQHKTVLDYQYKHLFILFSTKSEKNTIKVKSLYYGNHNYGMLLNIMFMLLNVEQIFWKVPVVSIPKHSCIFFFMQILPKSAVDLEKQNSCIFITCNTNCSQIPWWPRGPVTATVDLLKSQL